VQGRIARVVYKSFNEIDHGEVTFSAKF
jgi:hypothetical protein